MSISALCPQTDTMTTVPPLRVPSSADCSAASAHTEAARTVYTALMTVVREIPNRSAIRVFGTPSAASLLISAQINAFV